MSLNRRKGFNFALLILLIYSIVNIVYRKIIHHELDYWWVPVSIIILIGFFPFEKLLRKRKTHLFKS
ncbi:hypothetical protein [Terrilactibacillus laevilacticus]|uniref:Uncharacterized protein n=1 Tax=Terrilactibacillus laevilacticus TaxID=1380157 RepID=A0ABW5PKL2_9BACI|nr:hypothetical protein [Terrilactibacillus laevilacticus]